MRLESKTLRPLIIFLFPSVFNFLVLRNSQGQGETLAWHDESQSLSEETIPTVRSNTHRKPLIRKYCYLNNKSDEAIIVAEQDCQERTFCCNRDESSRCVRIFCLSINRNQ